MFPKYELLMRNNRSGLIDEEHLGLILQFDERGNILRKIGNDNGYHFYHRSCMKPLQLAAISAIIDKYNFTDEEIAVCAASHSGDEIHLKAIRSILNKVEANEGMLLCPPHQPLSYSARKKLLENKENPLSIHHNCSGKHASMLAYCKMKGYDTENYNEINHPLQKEVLQFISDLCEYPLSKCSLSKDGCTLPVIGTPLKNLAIGFIKVFTNNKFKKITNAILNCPYHFGGEKRTDTQIVIAGGKNLIAKVGAGNLCCVVDISEKSCLIIKISDTDNFARGFVLVQILQRLNKLPDVDKSNLSDLFQENITTDIGEIIGKREITFNF